LRGILLALTPPQPWCRQCWHYTAGACDEFFARDVFPDAIRVRMQRMMQMRAPEVQDAKTLGQAAASGKGIRVDAFQARASPSPSM